jgi:hypothetical protein
VDASSIHFLNTMLEYYFQGLDVSSLTDREWTLKLAHLLKIRQMEAEGQIAQTLNKILRSNEQ